MLAETLRARVAEEPFNLVATTIFVLAIVHTFLTPMFLRLAHRFEKKHRQALEEKGRKVKASVKVQVFHFLGEVETVFGLWVIPLLIAWMLVRDWSSARSYLVNGVSFTEPIFVVVIMAIAASRPVVRLAEMIMAGLARLGGSSTAAWWFSILTIGPLLGSLITEPAAMTICALLLGRKFYVLRPPPSLAYATLGLLFVNVSIGGTLTHFAAPPVLMVAGKWGWTTFHMLSFFGWRAALGIFLSTAVYFLWFQSEFKSMASVSPDSGADLLCRDANHCGADLRSAGSRSLWLLVPQATLKHSELQQKPIPAWVTVTTLVFLGCTIFNSHYSALILGGFLFYLGFVQATKHCQSEISLLPPLRVGFFLAGLVVHGGLQGWWIEPVLRSLGRLPLFFSATVLTAFNDNAAITFLASQVPDFSETLKYAVVAGAVTGGGLTVIANAPNPAGQSILSKYFPDGISAPSLLFGALAPTIIVALCFMVMSDQSGK